MAEMDIIDRLYDPNMYIDAVDDAIHEIQRLRGRIIAMKKLKSASMALAKELSSKKFPREHRDAYLSCFLNVGTIDDFLSALEKEK